MSGPGPGGRRAGSEIREGLVTPVPHSKLGVVTHDAPHAPDLAPIGHDRFPLAWVEGAKMSNRQYPHINMAFPMRQYVCLVSVITVLGIGIAACSSDNGATGNGAPRPDPGTDGDAMPNSATDGAPMSSAATDGGMLTVMNFLNWCSVAINGGTASTGATVTGSVPVGSVAAIVATPTFAAGQQVLELRRVERVAADDEMTEALERTGYGVAEIACHLRRPGAVRSRSDSRDVNAARLEVDDEQHEIAHEAADNQHFDAEGVRGRWTGRLDDASLDTRCLPKTLPPLGSGLREKRRGRRRPTPDAHRFAHHFGVSRWRHRRWPLAPLDGVRAFAGRLAGSFES